MARKSDSGGAAGGTLRRRDAPAAQSAPAFFGLLAATVLNWNAAIARENENVIKLWAGRLMEAWQALPERDRAKVAGKLSQFSLNMEPAAVNPVERFLRSTEEMGASSRATAGAWLEAEAGGSVTAPQRRRAACRALSFDLEGSFDALLSTAGASELEIVDTAMREWMDNYRQRARKAGKTDIANAFDVALNTWMQEESW